MFACSDITIVRLRSGQSLPDSLCKVRINNLNKKIFLLLHFSIVLLRSDIQHIILHIFLTDILTVPIDSVRRIAEAVNFN